MDLARVEVGGGAVGEEGDVSGVRRGTLASDLLSAARRLRPLSLLHRVTPPPRSPEHGRCGGATATASAIGPRPRLVVEVVRGGGADDLTRLRQALGENLSALCSGLVPVSLPSRTPWLKT